MENGKIWYAIMKDNDDQDWGTGTLDKAEAIKQVKELREDYPDAYIAVISDNGDPVCIDEIRDF